MIAFAVGWFLRCAKSIKDLQDCKLPAGCAASVLFNLPVNTVVVRGCNGTRVVLTSAAYCAATTAAVSTGAVDLTYR